MHNMGSVEAYMNSYYNLRRKLKEADVSKLPELLFACGTEDSFNVGEIASFKQFLKEINLEVKWTMGPGNHEWRVWERDIQIALDFFGKENTAKGNAF